MVHSSVTKGVLVTNEASQIVAALSHVNFQQSLSCEAQLVLLYCSDVLTAFVSPVPQLFKHAFMFASTGKGIDIRLVGTPDDGGGVLKLRYLDAPGSQYTLNLKAVHSEAKDEALGLFKQRVPMMGLFQNPQRPDEQDVEQILTGLDTMADSATKHQACLSMCAKLMQTRARENSALQARLESWGGKNRCLPSAYLSSSFGTGELLAGTANNTRVGSQDNSHQDITAQSTQSSGPESVHHFEAEQAVSSLSEPQEAPAEQVTKAEETPSQVRKQPQITC